MPPQSLQQHGFARVIASTSSSALLILSLCSCQTDGLADITGSLGEKTEKSSPAKSLEFYRDRHRANPNDTEAALNYGKALRASGQRAQAVAVLEQASQIATATLTKPLFYAHSSAEVHPSTEVGPGTKIWHQAQIRENVRIGSDCVISKDVYIDSGVSIGDRVKIQNGVSVYKGVILEDDTFVGPHAAFTNDITPRSFADDWEIVPTRVRRGAAIGANATIVCPPSPWSSSSSRPAGSTCTWHAAISSSVAP